MEIEDNHIDNALRNVSDSIIDGLVDDNTLVFDTPDSETIQRRKEERDREQLEQVQVAKKVAQELVESAKSLYTKDSDKVDYIKFKATADANSLGKILYQIEVNENAITRIMEAINMGDNNTNLFKCLTDLQETQIKLLKTKNLYLSSIEESFKQITSDIEMSNTIEADVVEDETTALTAKTKNARELMKLIAEASENIKTTQAKSEENKNGEN